MLDKNKIYSHLHELLNRAEIPVSIQSSAITRMIDNSRIDMCLKIDIMEYCAKLSCFERGMIVFEKYLNHEELIKFIMLKEVVTSYAFLLSQKHRDTDGYIDIAWRENFQKEAFSLIGEPYKSMYEKNINMFNIAD